MIKILLGNDDSKCQLTRDQGARLCATVEKLVDGRRKDRIILVAIVVLCAASASSELNLWPFALSIIKALVPVI